MRFTTPEQRAAMVPSAVAALLKVLGSARVAGGAVRDSLMGVVPKDWDVATSLTPDDVMAKSLERGYAVIETGLQHGTVTVVVEGHAVEVTTLRVDVATDGRHAEIEFTTDWRVDAERRDLTTNAMFMDAEGEVTDFFGGQEDMAAGVVRFVGSPTERMQEDYLRILRFFRFSGRMSALKFDRETMRAVRRNSVGLKRISVERVWMEMAKVLAGPNMVAMLEAMQTTGVLGVLGVDAPDMEAAELAASHRGVRPETVFAALVGRNAPQLAEQWKMSRSEQDTVAFVVNHKNERLHARSQADWEVLAERHGKDMVLQLMTLTHETEARDQLDAWDVPTFPVAGRDLLARDWTPGPGMGAELKRLREVWVKSHFTLTKDELLNG